MNELDLDDIDLEGVELAPQEETNLSITKPPILHFGGHFYLAKQLIWYIPEHRVYIEPFLGGGAMFWRKKLADENILNDLDDELIAIWKFIKDGGYKSCNYDNFCNMKNIKKCVAERKEKGYNTNICCSYMLRRIAYPRSNFTNIPNVKKIKNKFIRAFSNIVKNLDYYREKLKYAKLYSKDYREILDRYDCKSAFIYLDPPWDYSGEYADEYKFGESDFDFDKFFDVLLKIKGYFMFVHSENKRIFDEAESCGFKIYSIKVFSAMAMLGHNKTLKTRYVITNYHYK